MNHPSQDLEAALQWARRILTANEYEASCEEVAVARFINRTCQALRHLRDRLHPQGHRGVLRILDEMGAL